MILPMLILPLVTPLESLSLSDAVGLNGCRVVCTAKITAPGYYWNGFTILGCPERNDRIERTVMLDGERLDAEGQEVLVAGTLKVVHHGPNVVNGMPVPAWSEIVVVED
jgi:hypothetical protein